MKVRTNTKYIRVLQGQDEVRPAAGEGGERAKDALSTGLRPRKTDGQARCTRTEDGVLAQGERTAARLFIPSRSAVNGTMPTHRALFYLSL